MHGLVYEIFEHWAIHHHGLDTWHAIKEKAGCEVEDEAFVTRTYYRYDTWVDLINAASDQLDMSSSDILESYGHFNIKYHFDNGYGALLKCQGSTLRQWLSNLNAMHDHVQKSFPGDNYCPPAFWCEDCDEVEGSILLHYTSKRGNLLAPWVVGIVEEISVTFFEVDIKMHQLVLQAENGPASTTWRITAVDEAQQWKLSPSKQECLKENPVQLDSDDIPSRCPFTKRTPTAGQLDTGPTFSDKCPFTGKQLKIEKEPTGSISASTFPDYFSLSSHDEEQVGLTLKKMKEVFPFHILVNHDFYVLQAGRTLPRLLNREPEDFANVHIEEILQVTRPNMGGNWNWKALKKVSDQHFFVAPKPKQKRKGSVSISQIDNLDQKAVQPETKIKFKASMVQLSEDRIMFSLIPEVSNVADLEDFGLTLSDLPLTTSQRDTVFLGEYVTQEAGKAHKLDKLSRRLKKEENLSNALLYSIIPKGVAEELRKGKTVEPKFHENVTLFFSDVVGFTKICDLVEPWDVIDMMNQLYSVMDFLVKRFKLYKVETVGDSYMCCSGLPEPDEYHAENVANFSLAVIECVKHIKSPVDGEPIDLRIGIHTGSCTAGVVGTLTPHYCLFGDMVNTTSRHESTGIQGKIHCSSALFGRLHHFCKEDSHQYNFTPRGLIDMKGKGENYTYNLDSGTRHNASANPEALEGLYDEVKSMLSSKKWKMRKYFRKGGLFRRGDTLSGSSSGASSSGDSDSESKSRHSDSSYSGKSDEKSSVNSNDRDLEDDIEDDFEEDNVGAVIDFSTEQLLHLNRNWEELQWEEALSQTQLISKVFDVLISTLTTCVHKEGRRLEVMEEELHGYIQLVAGLYSEENPFHNFHHAAQVFLRANFLWEDRIYDESGRGKNPWDRFILLFSALIHDVKHTGVTNKQLEVENHVIYQKHKKRDSYQERYSFDCALEMLEEDFAELYEEIAFGCPNFRSAVRKVVLSTNMESEDSVRNMIQKFEQVMEKPCVDARVSRDQSEAGLGIILAMAEVGHYSQGFDILLGWNQRQFQEHLQGYRCGRADDPRNSWYNDQVMFFHDTVLPLIAQVGKVLPEASYLEAKAKRNVESWRKSGREWIAACMLPSAKVDSGDRLEKLVAANVDMLERLLQDVVASHTQQKSLGHLDHETPGSMENPFDEIKVVIEMRRRSIDTMQSTQLVGPRPELSRETRSELRDLVITIASGYEKNAFHNFLHASHVAHLANLLLSGANENDFDCDPLARFSIVLSALIHDVGHTGVPNGRLGEENPELAEKFRNKSIAEQNSIVTAWDILMTDSFRNLHHCLFESTKERERLRSLLVNCVMATDIFDSDLRALRQARWEKVFPEGPTPFECSKEEANCKATVVTEHIMQASDVAHTMQEWDLYRQWNECLYFEMYDAFLEGRAEEDPSDGWYKGELWFFDNWVIPLAQNLSACGVLDMVSEQLLKQAKHNRLKWEMEGEEISRLMIKTAKTKRKARRTLSSMSSDISVASELSSAMLTSQIVSEVETLSKVVKRYEKKMEAAVGTLIAVAYKGQPGASDLKRKSTSKIHEHFREQEWYRMYSDDDDMSADGSDVGSVRSSLSRRSSTRRPIRRIQVNVDNCSLVESNVNLVNHLSIAEDIVESARGS